MKIIQFGDLHLDAPFETLSTDGALMRRNRMRSIPQKIISIAEKTGSEIILCSGDIFDSLSPTFDSVSALRDAFAATNIPIFVTPGNHDPYCRVSPWKAVKWSDNVKIFTESTPQCISFGEVIIAGSATCDMRTSIRVFENFRFENPNLLHICMFHGDLDTYGPYSHALTNDIALSGCDYCAIGHIHKGFQKKNGNLLAVMNGSPESLTFGDSGEHGIIFADIRPNGESRAELIPIGGMKNFSLSLEDNGLTCAQIASATAECCPNDPQLTLLTLTLSGTGIAPVSGIYESLALGTCGFAAARIIDNRISEISSDGLTGLLPNLFRQKLNKMLTSSDNLSEKMIHAALQFGSSAMLNNDRPTNLFD